MEVEIAAPPTDGVTSICFSTVDNLSAMLVSSWDSVLRLYDGPKLRVEIEHDSALLSCCFGQSDTVAYSGGLDGCLYQVSMLKREKSLVGKHASAIRHVQYSMEHGLVCSGGWDCMVKFFDARSHPEMISAEVDCNGKIFAMDLRSNLLLVATSERQVQLHDLRNLKAPAQNFESPTKYQTRCVRLFPSLEGYALGSIEGRVALEYFADLNLSTAQAESGEGSSKKLSYAFKCHRSKVDQEQTFVYPVNCIAFQPQYGTFATGGCDGIVNVWDGRSKKRIHQYSKYPTSIAAMDFNHDGSILAVASSYTFEEGEKDHPNDAIFLRTVQESECRPKAKSSAA